MKKIIEVGPGDLIRNVIFLDFIYYFNIHLFRSFLSILL